MATIHKLSYTASEIDEKLGKIKDIDQTYDSTSENAQSGKAVAEAISKIIKRQEQHINFNLYPSKASSIFNGYITGEGDIILNDEYVSYQLDAVSYDYTLYFDESTYGYVQLCIFDKNVTKENFIPPRMRLSENNMPLTKESSLVVCAGQIVVVTRSLSTQHVGIYTTWGSPLLIEDVIIDQIGLDKTCGVLYINAPTNLSSEYLKIYVPSNVGYIQYDFIHNIFTERNVDVWRMEKAYACDDTFEQRFNLTTDGEWECALKLKDRDDFSGGISHGDEKVTNVIFLLDGCPVNISSLSEITRFNEMRIVQTSNMYDPIDGTTLIATHGSEHIFTKEGLKIIQTVQWVKDVVATQCYMAMHLPAKACTDKMYNDKTFAVYDVGSGVGYGLYNNAKRVSVYGEQSGVYTNFDIEEYTTGLSGGNCLLVADNGTDDYHKCYFVILNNSDGINISANTEWRAVTKYNFTTNK